MESRTASLRQIGDGKRKAGGRSTGVAEQTGEEDRRRGDKSTPAQRRPIILDLVSGVF